VSPLNTHRLLVISVMVAAKFQDDIYYGNDYYARVAGVSLKEINTLEDHFLRLLSWRANVSVHEYTAYHAQMLGTVTDRPGDLHPLATEDASPSSDALMPDSSVESTKMHVGTVLVPTSAPTRSRLAYKTSKLCAKRHQTRQFTGSLGVSKAMAKVPRWSREQTCGVRRRALLVNL